MNKHTKKAFTIIELLMVLSTIALMTALFLPSSNVLKKETRHMSTTKNKDILTGLVGMKLTRLRTNGLIDDELLNALMTDLTADPTVSTMSNPFDSSKKGIGLIKGDTYDDSNKASYIFTEKPNEETLPEGTVYTVVSPDQLKSEEPSYVEVNPGTIVKEPKEMVINIGSVSTSTVIEKNNNTYVLGNNTSGQLGIGNKVSISTPTPLKLTTTVGVKSIVLGSAHSLAIGTDGNLYTWGNNSYGQLGDGTTTAKLAPILINLPNGVKPLQIAIGYNHSLVLGNDNNIYAWGRNEYCQLGTTIAGDKLTPTIVPLPNNIKPKSMYGGADYTMIIDAEGNLYSWGYNSNGQLGDGTTVNKTTPTLITLPNNIKPTQIAKGTAHVSTIGTDGNLYTWGYNYYGQLGNGTTSDKSTPTLINLPNGVKPKSIASGAFHSLAIGDDGNLYSWGYNSFGQLGDGTTVNKLIPTLINLPYNLKPKSIKVGAYHTIVTTTTGEIYAWGHNIQGQLGTGDIVNRTTPTLIKTFDDLE